jgi:LacI family transcriptional regulator
VGNITIADVARQAKVSIATVSNAVNGTRSVSSELKSKIFKAIDELGYEPDYLAKNLKRNTTMTIGVVITSLQRIFFPEVLIGIQTMAGQHGYNVLINLSEDSIEKEMMLVKMLVDSKVDGIIIHTLCSQEDERHLSFLGSLSRYNKRIPVVSLERNLVSKNISSIFADNYHGGRLATEHLVETGAENIICIKGPDNSEVSNDRMRAFLDVMAEHGYQGGSNNVYTGDYSPLSGYRVTRRLLLNGIKPHAIFACNDQMAIGAINAINEYGLKIPGDIKVVGYDNTFVASIVSPQLTTINVPKARMGQEAFSLLYKHMTETREADDINKLKHVFKAEGVKVPIDLIVRQSTVESAQTYAWDLEDW